VSFSKEFVVRTKTQQLDYLCGLVYPYQEKVVLNVTLQTALINPMEPVGLIFGRHATRTFEEIRNLLQSKKF
jgi:hypothetical protein